MTSAEVQDLEVAELQGEPEPPGRSPAPAPSVDGAGDRRPLREQIAEHARRRVIVIVAIGILLVFAWWLCSSPISSIWYDSRQRQLASEFQEAQRKLLVGHAAGVLQIPKLGMNVVMVEGDGEAELRSGPGHVPKSPLPGVRGNSVIVGHRSAWGGPFADLGDIQKGDLVVVKTRAQKRGAPSLFVYKVTKTETVKSDDDRLFGPSKDFRLTLVTSAGGTFGTDRRVVVATSGTASKKPLGPAHGTAPSSGGSVEPVPAGVAVLAFVLAWFVWSALRRRRGPLAVVVVLAPIVLAGILATFLELDLFLGPLR